MPSRMELGRKCYRLQYTVLLSNITYVIPVPYKAHGPSMKKISLDTEMQTNQQRAQKINSSNSSRCSHVINAVKQYYKMDIKV